MEEGQKGIGWHEADAASATRYSDAWRVGEWSEVSNMKTLSRVSALGMVGSIGLLGLASAAAQDVDRAKLLYENHCQLCHEDWAHTRDQRRVRTIDGLRSQVASWSVHAGLSWTREDIEQVTRYLNERFYRLSE